MTLSGQLSNRVRTRSRLAYLPRLEALEQRLPPGALVGALVGWPEVSEPNMSRPPIGKRVPSANPELTDLYSLALFNASSTTPERVRVSTSPPLEEIVEPLQASVFPTIGFEGSVSAGSGNRGLIRHPTPETTGTYIRKTNVGRALAAAAPVFTSGTLQDASMAGLAVPPSPAKTAQPHYNHLPLSFEANHGQTDSRADFITRAAGYTAFLTPTALVMSLPGQSQNFGVRRPGMDSPNSESPADHSIQGVALHMQIVGGNPDAQASGDGQLPGIVNYFIGNDPTKWRTNIPTFGRVEYDNVYSGIDLVYYGTKEGQLEYDFVVAPGANPGAIRLNFAGAEGVEINPQGDLVLHTAAGDVVQQKPLTFQAVGDSRQEVSSGYVLDGDTVRFEVGAYDAGRELVIDPFFHGGYSTFLGGSGADDASDVVLDTSGRPYVTGLTQSTDFPTTAGVFDTSHNGAGDVFVAKLNASGNALEYATFLGGTDDDKASQLIVDNDGNAHLTGYTRSTDFSTTLGAFDSAHNGGTDAFVAELNASGNTLTYATFLGGSNDDYGSGIALGANGTYVAGYTRSTNFPTTLLSFNPTFNGGVTDAFVTKLNAAGNALVYSTFLGGNENDEAQGIAVDMGGSAYVASDTRSSNIPVTPGAFDTTANGGLTDAFVTKLNPAGDSLAYCTYLGGNDEDYLRGGIVVDSGGSAYVGGTTGSLDFPVTTGAFDTTYNGAGDAFVVKFNAAGSAPVYATFVGGFGSDFAHDIAIDGAGNAYLTGDTQAMDFPVTSGALDTTYNGGGDVFVAKLSSNGAVCRYGTFLGGSSSDYGRGIDVDGSGKVVVTGLTQSTDFPTTPGAFDTTQNGAFYSDAFVTKFNLLEKAPAQCSLVCQ